MNNSGNVNINSKEIDVNADDFNVNSNVNLQSGESAVKVSPESINLEANTVKIGSENSLLGNNIVFDSTATTNRVIDYTGSNGQPVFNNFSDTATIGVNGKMQSTVLEGTTAVQIADTIIHQEKQGPEELHFLLVIQNSKIFMLEVSVDIIPVEEILILLMQKQEILVQLLVSYL